MISRIFLLLIIAPELVWSCGSDVAGSSSKSAEFGISFLAPLAYTYPPPDVAAVPGQSPTMDIAKRRVQVDLDLAIAKGITANQIYLYIPPTVNFTFTPPKVQIADGEVCQTDGTYIAIDGTLWDQCVAEKSTIAPVSGATGSPVGASTDTASSATTDSNTAPTVSNTMNERDDFHALPRRRAASAVKGNLFVQTMTVVATASQELYESQWKKIAWSVQQALQEKKWMFDDDIQVTLL